VAAQAQKHFRLFALAFPALLIACAIALGASTTANAGAAKQATVAADGIDGSCDPFDDVGDPDCWDDDGEDTDDDDWGDEDSDDDFGPPAITPPTGPVAPPVINWPAPPKGAYAKLRANGRTAAAPKAAPKPIKAMIRAANSITRKPYKWGGGHARWYDRGYDCSGATSFILRAGGYVNYPMASGDLAKWGAKGAGNWVRIYANKTHVFMVIAGLRFDTSAYGAGGGDGPRWRSTVRPTGGFKLRHPAGL
jgi:cell wall-associated NlpC family hydrolase